MTLLEICEWLVTQRTSILLAESEGTMTRNDVADIILPYACIYRATACGGWGGLLVNRRYGVLGLIENSIKWGDSDKWFDFKSDFAPVFHKNKFLTKLTDRTYFYDSRLSVVRNRPLPKSYLARLGYLEASIIAPNFNYVIQAFL